MELRIKKLEDFAETAQEEFRSIDVRLTRIESGLNELRSTVKADMAELNASLIKWIVGTVLAAGAVAISIMTFVLNHAVSKPPPPPLQQTPIYITVPQAQPSAASPRE